MKKNIYVMSKVPFRGLSKKRLSKDIGFNLSQRLTFNNIEKMKKISLLKSKEYKFYWYITPFIKFNSYSFLFSNNCIKQKGSDLGKRIWHIFSNDKNPFIILGSDIPGIKLFHIEELFYYLRSNDLVIGPSTDGGFWALGYSNKRKIVYPFHNVRWSDENTLSDLLGNLKKNKIRFQLTSELTDIDNIKDYCKNKLGLNKPMETYI